ncbi:alpha/beta hydrolase [Novosphingobium sp. TH158]|uniref:alpha/beta hydrolase n=1 Tax=Novosphingobium sp. TH158 TaxID=2067455 RepID=UPI000C7A2724|nr:alpha/beta hydrolase [Novosphingobium sp. TH158]PLK24375.1 lysophospholipase [Novosphingobium sp. TH158]
MSEASRQPFDGRTIPAGATESRWIAPDGHAIRRIDWPAPQPCRGSILFLPGRGDFYEKYLEALAYWNSRGWRVTSADWRGQAGSGRLGSDAVTGHVGDFVQWVDDLAALWEDWKASTPGPHVLAAHSMGGHIVLRALVERRVDPDAMVLSAPMLGFHTYGLPLPVLHVAARLMCALGDRRRPAWKWSEKPGQVPEGRDVLLTHDARRYEDEMVWREQRPELVMGPGSWGWVERAYASARLMFAAGRLEAVGTPVFIVATSEDKLVSADAIRLAARRLPACEMLMFGKEARHEILREADGVRDRALAAIDDFLDRKAPKRN